MEKSIEEESRRLESIFGVKAENPESYSPLTLAYLGDAVYELLVRTLVVEESNAPGYKRSKRSSRLVNAGTQARMIRAIEPLLTEKEEKIYKRGRNAKTNSMAKHATVTDYHMATGFESLMGYLYLAGEFDRMMDLVAAGFSAIKEQEGNL